MSTTADRVSGTRPRARLRVADAYLDQVPDLARAFRPREACEPAPGVTYWQQEPTPKQQAYLAGDVRERLYGGAAGGGKSSALLMAALQYVCVPGYQALLVRRTYPQLADAGGLIERAKAWLMPLVEAGHVDWNDSRHRFTFPSGAGVWFNFANRNDDRWKFQSSEYQMVGFDELTHWPDPVVYTYVGFSRVRGPAVPCDNCGAPLVKRTGEWRHEDVEADDECGDPEPAIALPACPSCGLTLADVPLRTMAGTNPGGRGHGWTRRRFGLHGFGQRYREHVKRFPDRQFVRATMVDNPHLNVRAYQKSLAELEVVERRRLELGDWQVTEGGAMFQRVWFVGDAA